MTTLDERIKTIKEELKCKNNASLAHKIGVNETRIKTLSSKKAGGAFKSEEIEVLVEKYDFNAYWLISGKGEIYQTSQHSNELYYFKKISQKVSAGHGEEYHLESQEDFSICKNLFKTSINPKEYKVLEVTGKSMQPTLQDQDHVIIKEKHSFDGDDLYVIRKGNELFVKRVVKDMDGNCIIESDNPNYSNTTIDKDTDVEHFIVGKVKAILPRIAD